jgi:hypothetical protein
MRREEARMQEDKFDILGPLLSDIGGEIAEIVGGNPDGAYLYSEAGDGWIGTSVFKDEGDVVRYFDPPSELEELLLEFRNTEKPGKRWTVMEYEIIGTKFDARFKYPEEVDPKFFDGDRREIALKKRYGDKPIVYPPWPGQDAE